MSQTATFISSSFISSSLPGVHFLATTASCLRLPVTGYPRIVRYKNRCYTYIRKKVHVYVICVCVCVFVCVRAIWFLISGRCEPADILTHGTRPVLQFFVCVSIVMLFHLSHVAVRFYRDFLTAISVELREISEMVLTIKTFEKKK